MSRIGKKPIPVTAGVKVDVKGNVISVTGPKGTLTHTCTSRISISYDAAAQKVNVDRANDTREAKAEHGLNRTIISNMITGVTTGWSKSLEIIGTGYKGNVQGKNLNLALGYSHPIVYAIPAGITLVMPDANKITVSGADKQLVGQVAANIRFFRKPEPYKGKGIRYTGEHIALKEGKAAGKKK